MLVLRLLSAVEFRLNDRPLTVIERSPLLAELLAYLALNSRRAHPRPLLPAQGIAIRKRAWSGSPGT